MVTAAVEGDRARFISLVQTSLDRTAPPCPHFESCGGCVAQHMATALYRDWKHSLVGAALGLTNLDIMEREGLVQQSADVGAYLLKSLTERVDAHAHVGEVRGAGQMIAVEFIADKSARRFFDPKANAHRLVSAKALEFGVLTRALPFIEVTSFSPPLCMTRTEADEAVDLFGNALDAVTPELAKLAGGG